MVSMSLCGVVSRLRFVIIMVPVVGVSYTVGITFEVCNYNGSCCRC
jgi:hypothetical protein